LPQIISRDIEKSAIGSIHLDIAIADYARPSFAIGCDEIAKGFLSHRRWFGALRHQARAGQASCAEARTEKAKSPARAARLVVMAQSFLGGRDA